MTSLRRPTRLVALALATTFAIVACGSDETADPGDATGAADATATTTTSTTVALVGSAGGGGADEPAATTTEAPAPVEETTTTAPAPEAAPADCLVGQWSLRSQEFLDEIVASVPADIGLTTWEHVSGDYLIDINADGTTRGQRLAWKHRIGTSEGNLLTTIDSDDPGTYTVDGNMISVTDDASSATVKLEFEVGGVVQSLPVGGQQTVGTDGISGSGTFTCEGDVLSVLLTDLPDAPPGGFRATMDRVG